MSRNAPEANGSRAEANQDGSNTDEPAFFLLEKLESMQSRNPVLVTFRSESQFASAGLSNSENVKYKSSLDAKWSAGVRFEVLRGNTAVLLLMTHSTIITTANSFLNRFKVSHQDC